ncbi:GGDEF domain-containing protein [Mycolicibacterium komossense]|uniref:GGDEF domain-containing protein n=1 Tax=Mycolicibacterium komossense TaxID=1779 RepID=A0ABT3C5C8_9MYCO|nr:GGDEF domain-containing protein [Mycolicibacterium komossense]MCV7224625.1 GGDEF domain-containing protein [Mycolicibacterium komossense]
MVQWIDRWRQQSDQFDWFSAYLKDRGLETQWRIATFAFTVLLAALPVVMLWSPYGPDRPATVALSVAAAGAGAVSAGVWLIRWPSRRQSVLLSVMATGSIAVICLAQSNAYAGLEGCHIFAIIGGFIAYFHTVEHLIANLAVALTCTAVLAHQLAVTTGDIALVVASLITITAVNVGVPFGIYSLVHTLRSDLRSSDRDSLTELLNRRSFYHSVHELLNRRHTAADRYLVVIAIDLDHFKQLNDTRGHAIGDQALVGVGAALRQNCRATSVIARIGGEEFVIADVDSTPEASALAERLRHAIAALPMNITASIGTASAPLKTIDARADRQLVDALMNAADGAMYDAKRAGGNQICHHPEASPIDSA